MGNRFDLSLSRRIAARVGTNAASNLLFIGRTNFWRYFMKAFRNILLAGLMLVPFAVSAQAADLAPDEAAASEAMGLYLRGDAGMSFLNWSGGDDDAGLSVGGGIGYRYNNNMRTDLTVDWNGDYSIGAGANLSTTTVLGNLYYDFANDSAFTPYVGAGLGYGWVNRDIGTDRSGLAYGLTAGVAVDLTTNMAIDVGYRFRDTMIKGSDPYEHAIVAGVRFSF
jgi:opacity protein-like surface antigen